MIRGIKFVSIPVRDQRQAIAFYTEKLGMRIMTDQPFEAGQRWVELAIPGADTRLVPFTPKGHEQRIGTFSGISLWTDDVQGTYEELSAKGVEFQGPPAKQEWGTFVILKDPDGNQFVLGSK